MKLKWEEPKIAIQNFTPNEYVAACVKGVIACAFPGRSSTEVDDGTSTYTETNGVEHGLCGNWAPITFDSGIGSGYEVDNGVVQRNREISNIPVQDYVAGNNYNISWRSTNDGGKSYYYHTGVLKVSNVDDTRPNHS